LIKVDHLDGGTGLKSQASVTFNLNITADVYVPIPSAFAVAVVALVLMPCTTVLLLWFFDDTAKLLSLSHAAGLRNIKSR